MLKMKTSANVLPIPLTGLVQQLFGTNPNRVAIIFPATQGAQSYSISFQNSMSSAVLLSMTPTDINLILTIGDIGTLIQLPIFIRSNGVFTAEFTEVVSEPEEC